MVTMEQHVRNILETLYGTDLMPVDPQTMSAGDLCGAANYLDNLQKGQGEDLKGALAVAQLSIDGLADERDALRKENERLRKKLDDFETHVQNIIKVATCNPEKLSEKLAEDDRPPLLGNRDDWVFCMKCGNPVSSWHHKNCTDAS